jgi:hypothetical protein
VVPPVVPGQEAGETGDSHVEEVRPGQKEEDERMDLPPPGPGLHAVGDAPVELLLRAPPLLGVVPAGAVGSGLAEGGLIVAMVPPQLPGDATSEAEGDGRSDDEEDGRAAGDDGGHDHLPLLCRGPAGLAGTTDRRLSKA